jgi:hypothetical protein
VDLLGRYSNRTSWSKRLNRLPKATSEAATTTVRARRSTPTRLSPAQISELIDGYQRGQTVYELAVRLYEDGWSVARIGERLGVDGTTAWTAIKAQGTRMRDAHRREQTLARFRPAGGEVLTWGLTRLWIKGMDGPP